MFTESIPSAMYWALYNFTFWKVWLSFILLFVCWTQANVLQSSHSLQTLVLHDLHFLFLSQFNKLKKIKSIYYVALIRVQHWSHLYHITVFATNHLNCKMNCLVTYLIMSGISLHKYFSIVINQLFT